MCIKKCAQVPRHNRFEIGIKVVTPSFNYVLITFSLVCCRFAAVSSAQNDMKISMAALRKPKRLTWLKRTRNKRSFNYDLRASTHKLLKVIHVKMGRRGKRLLALLFLLCNAFQLLIGKVSVISGSLDILHSGLLCSFWSKNAMWKSHKNCSKNEKKGYETKMT